MIDRNTIEKAFVSQMTFGWVHGVHLRWNLIMERQYENKLYF